MRVLFTGGTGNISTACTALALEKGIEVFHLNRGTRPEREQAGVRSLKADIRDPEAVRRALGSTRFDAVVQFLAFRPEHIETDLGLFVDKTDHYVFISTCSAYKKPSLTPWITEDTPLENPFWEYSRLKAACEETLRKGAARLSMPYSIVRPSHTYDDGWIPGCFGSGSYGLAWRMLKGLEVVVPGDGQSLWTLTHASDFALGLIGLLGKEEAFGEAFHITSDERLTWDAIHRIIGQALGVEPRIVHVTSEYIARLYPERGAGLLGDKAVSVLFDNSKIRRLVRDFSPRISFEQGIRKSLAWFDQRPAMKIPDATMNAEMDDILKRWKAGYSF
ncbi:MAG: NAD-dependent epimerase/dehydratase family protein [Spirochaetia bacterium]|nr:NAD-dependent epimerase/dehydratase family protein [Spirochaetia bacterium]MCE1208055.1 NAD-dependent epimerase/dehydratase family protein [Spirochaetia bacterium]